MLVVSTREFRDKMGKYIDLVCQGEDVILKSRGKGSFKLSAVTEDDTLMSKGEFLAMVDHSLQQAKDGKVHSMLPNESLDEFLERIKCTE